MKIALGQRLREGPWGGGNSFLRSLIEHLDREGHQIVFTLSDADIDLILLTDPRARNPQVSFTPGQVLRYLLFCNPRAVVVHRINECDERKGTRGMNARLRLANYCADHTVFIASWLTELDIWRRDLKRSYSVILNGADARIFHSKGHQLWDSRRPLRLVTHHWGGNHMKGLDVYRQLDAMLDDTAWSRRVEFTFVGNLLDGVTFRNARHVPPLCGQALADELRSHHVYLTASLNEPAGMHHIEGALCGLPLLYRNSGALPEYCNGFGVGFDGADFENALRRLMDDYAQWQPRMAHYQNTADRMCRGYLDLFADLLSRRSEVLARRSLWRDPWPVVRNQIPI